MWRCDSAAINEINVQGKELEGVNTGVLGAKKLRSIRKHIRTAQNYVSAGNGGHVLKDAYSACI